MLVNLNVLANESKAKYLREYTGGDRKLHQQFKDTFSNSMRNAGRSVRFFDYSAEVTTTKKIFLPNQWFIVAAYMADYVAALLKYKEELEEIFNTRETGTTWNKLPEFKNTPISPVFRDAIIQHFNGDHEQTEYMTNYITNYQWWHGSKTIDRRHDFYVSPVLSLLGVVAASQGYIAEIALEYATNSQLRNEAITLIDHATALNDHDTEQIDLQSVQAVTGGKNLIVYGAPGTGKSHYLENYSEIKKENMFRITFHPEYTYYDFVGSYKPSVVYKQPDGTLSEERTGEPIIDYQFIPGPFSNALKQALNNKGEMHMLLIEEINRANAAAVFGDLFQLLDRAGNGESVYRIKSDAHLLKYINSDDIYIPSNLHIFATMNSADQGVFTMDSAFKRRWNFMYLPIRFTAETQHRDELVHYGGGTVTWEKFVTAINKRLGQLNINEDKHIGPYFMKTGEPSVPDNIASKLLIYLWDDVVRYHRKEFFKPVATFAELVQAYYEGEDIITSFEPGGVVITQDDDESIDEQ